MNTLAENNKCALGKKNTKYTCLTKKDVVDVLKQYNRYVSKNQRFKVTGDKLSLYGLLKGVSSVPDDTEIWKEKFIKDQGLKTRLKKYTFKPVGPEKFWGWTTSDQITDVMNQYSKHCSKFKKNFMYYDTVPSDHFTLHPKELTKIKNSTKPVGIVFNTDPTSKEGQHWIAVYVDPKKDSADFFDSYGDPPNKNIKTFLKNFKHVSISKAKYQKRGGACGLYAISYLVNRVNKKPIQFGGDLDVNLLRLKIFR
jgi:hypothetical protein